MFESVVFKRVISYPNGEVIFYYKDKKVTISKSGESITDIKIDNKKEINGFLNRPTAIRNSSDRNSGNKLYDAISAFDRVTRRNY